MSSKYLEKAWCHSCVTMEEKLVLVALAELADRDGAVITTTRELMAMTSSSESGIVNIVGKLSINQDITGLNRRSSFNDGYIKCKLNIDPSPINNANYEASHEHNSGINKIPKFHRSQTRPLNSNRGSGKVINITQLSPSIVEDWAEVIMFKAGFSGQSSAWASFVEKVKTSSNSIISLEELTSQLHAHLCNEKNYKLRSASTTKPNTKPVKLSPHQEYAQKLSNLNFDD